MNIDHITSASSIQTYDQGRQTRGEQRTNNDNSHLKNGNERSYTERDIKQAVDSLNGFVEPLYTNLKFVYHDELNEYYVTVINPLTNEVIKEIPPKKMLDMYASMAESMGILIDEKV